MLEVVMVKTVKMVDVDYKRECIVLDLLLEPHHHLHLQMVYVDQQMVLYILPVVQFYLIDVLHELYQAMLIVVQLVNGLGHVSEHEDE